MLSIGGRIGGQTVSPGKAILILAWSEILPNAETRGCEVEYSVALSHGGMDNVTQAID